VGPVLSQRKSERGNITMHSNEKKKTLQGKEITFILEILRIKPAQLVVVPCVLF